MPYNYRQVMKSFWQHSDRFIGYQLITKAILSFLLIPSFAIATRLLMHARGHQILSHTNIARFLWSPQGAIFSVLAMILVFLSLLIELGGFILISTKVLNNQPLPGWRQLLRYNFKKLPSFLGPGGGLVLIYGLILLPLTGLGPKSSLLSWVRIPPFIMDVIKWNDGYLFLYALVIILFGLFSLRWIFTFHFMLLRNMSAFQAIKASSRLVWGNRKAFFKWFLGLTILLVLVAGVITVAWIFLVMVLIEFLELSRSLHQSILLFAYMLQYWVLSLVTLIAIPFQVHQISALFYRLVGRDPRFQSQAWLPPSMPERRPSRLHRLLRQKGLLLLASVVLIALVALPMGFVIQDLKQPYQSIGIIAHRGGGFEAPENSIAGLQHAYNLGVVMAEIDVQRTKDGAYILNHDNTFSRVAWDERTPQEMTLAEIKQLDIGYTHDVKYTGERVPTLQEALAFAKEKQMTLFIELKGVSADAQMVEDVMAILESYDMVSDVVLVSLDVDLIEYIEEHYDIDTGLIYFAGFGDFTKLKGNYLIIEAALATQSKIESIQKAGKSAIVWTINEDQAMNRMARSRVDAIITDRMSNLVELFQQLDNQSDQERLFDLFIGIRNK